MTNEDGVSPGSYELTLENDEKFDKGQIEAFIKKKNGKNIYHRHKIQVLTH